MSKKLLKEYLKNLSLESCDTCGENNVMNKLDDANVPVVPQNDVVTGGQDTQAIIDDLTGQPQEDNVSVEDMIDEEIEDIDKETNEILVAPEVTYSEETYHKVKNILRDTKRIGRYRKVDTSYINFSNEDLKTNISLCLAINREFLYKMKRKK